jgi:N-acetylmuramic acid 6-phosphate etherase
MSDSSHDSRVVRRSSEHGGQRGGDTDVDALLTERVRPDLDDLDERPVEELVALLLDAEATVPSVVAHVRSELAAAVRLVEQAFARQGRLVYIGAGTPGRLAAVDAAECPPTFSTPPGQVVAVLAGGNEAAAAAVEGAEDDDGAGRRDVGALDLTSADVVVGISASGRTPYVVGALEAARERGARTVAVVNNPDSSVGAGCDVVIELLTGVEVLAGSTRLKAGTAQKVVLNTLSTSAMIRAGKTYGAWMVDVAASNEKLRRRARRIVREATGVDDAEAIRVLDECDWHTKTALVAVLAGLDAEAARARLTRADGRVRRAVEPTADA